MRLTTFIYALCEPGTKTIRYFGKADNPRHRYNSHVSNAKNCVNNYHTTRWVKKLQNNGQSPDMHVLCEVPRNDFARFERAFIALGRKDGMDLTNISDGGEGVSMPGEKNPNWGKKQSPEQIAKFVARMKGRSPWNRGRKSPETSGEKNHNFGKKFPPETCAKMSAAMKGRKPAPRSEQSLKKQGDSHRGMKRPDSSSKFFGVHFEEVRGAKPWRASISVLGARKHLGCFITEEEAAFSYDQASKKFHGEKAKLNFPDGQ